MKHAPGHVLLYQYHYHLCVEVSTTPMIMVIGSLPPSSIPTLGGGGIDGVTISMWSLSSAEVEYRAMAHASFEMLSVHWLLHELCFLLQRSIPVFCDIKL